MVYRFIRLLVSWSIGISVYCYICRHGILVYWYIGLLVSWSLGLVAMVVCPWWWLVVCSSAGFLLVVWGLVVYRSADSDFDVFLFTIFCLRRVWCDMVLSCFCFLSHSMRHDLLCLSNKSKIYASHQKPMKELHRKIKQVNHRVKFDADYAIRHGTTCVCIAEIQYKLLTKACRRS